MANIIFNKESYDLAVAIITSETIPSIENGIYPLYNEHISCMTIGNDLLEFGPVLMLEYRDIGNFNVINYFANGLSYIHLDLTHLDSGNTLSHDFMIDDIQILSRDMKQTVFKITAKSFYWTKLESMIAYSTMKSDELNSSIPTTTIIRQLANKVDYTIASEKDDEMTMASDRKLAYATPDNVSIRRSINWLLKQSCTTSSGLFFLYWNMLEDTGKILSTYKAYSNWKEKMIVGNVFRIPSEFGNSSEYLSTNDLAFTNPLGGILGYPIGSVMTLNEFDYATRSWKEDRFDFKKMSKGLPITENGNYESNYQEFDKYKLGSFDIDTPNASYVTFSEKLRRLMLFSENLQFNTYGSIVREVGQLAAVAADDVLINRRFGGAWMIARQLMRFTRGNFISSMTLVRADRMKTSTESKA